MELEGNVDRYLNGEVWIEDLGSTNGTFVNGERVTRTQVHLGDRILV
ncbi:MAG: FHA domain-containing protein, partial [Dehalococcoidia bacterium]